MVRIKTDTSGGEERSISGIAEEELINTCPVISLTDKKKGKSNKKAIRRDLMSVPERRGGRREK